MNEVSSYSNDRGIKLQGTPWQLEWIHECGAGQHMCPPLVTHLWLQQHLPHGQPTQQKIVSFLMFPCRRNVKEFWEFLDTGYIGISKIPLSGNNGGNFMIPTFLAFCRKCTGKHQLSYIVSECGILLIPVYPASRNLDNSWKFSSREWSETYNFLLCRFL